MAWRRYLELRVCWKFCVTKYEQDVLEQCYINYLKSLVLNLYFSNLLDDTLKHDHYMILAVAFNKNLSGIFPRIVW